MHDFKNDTQVYYSTSLGACYFSSVIQPKIFCYFLISLKLLLSHLKVDKISSSFFFTLNKNLNLKGLFESRNLEIYWTISLEVIGSSLTPFFTLKTNGH